MKKVFLSLIIALMTLFNHSRTSLAQISVPAKTDTDYSQYLGTIVYKNIIESQGTINYEVLNFDDTDRNVTQALIFDPKDGLVISVAHAVSQYPAVAFSKSTEYSFIYRGKVYPARLRAVSHPVDLAIFKIEKSNLSELKSATFNKESPLFQEYYGFKQDLDHDDEGDISISARIPWKARLVEKYAEKIAGINVEKMIFDRSITFGFSGAGVFNSDGHVVGIFEASLLPGGFSRAISASTMLDFIKEYKDREEEAKKKSKR